MSEELKRTYEELEEENKTLIENLTRLVDQEAEKQEQKRLAKEQNDKDEEKEMMGVRGTCIANACSALKEDSRCAEKAAEMSVVTLAKDMYKFVLKGDTVKNE